MKIGSLIVDLQAKDVSPEETEILQHPMVGGVIFFSRNFESRQQLQEMIKHIRTKRKTPCLFMVDQEGGRVQRFKDEFTAIPAMARFGEQYDKEPQAALKNASACGRLLAQELLSLGLDLNLGPVLDLYNQQSRVIGDRAFHADPRIVIHLAKAMISGMQQAGMAAVAKHFPGHGSVIEDTHIEMVSDPRLLQEVLEADILPFKNLIQAGLPAVMAAHLLFPNIDSKPVGYSSFWLRDILRTQLHFNGAIFSDDLNMEGANISANFADRVEAVTEAGCDFALLCNNRKGVIDVLDNTPKQPCLVNEEKWMPLIGNLKIHEGI